MSVCCWSESTVREALRQVVDPELDCNIVDLGLIYGIAIHGSRVTVSMTLTSPGCPMQESLARGVKSALLGLEGIDDVEVNVVWEPPWTPALMSDYGREWTGVFDS